MILWKTDAIQHGNICGTPRSQKSRVKYMQKGSEAILSAEPDQRVNRIINALYIVYMKFSNHNFRATICFPFCKHFVFCFLKSTMHCS